MELNERVDKLEDEVKIVKNEVQAVLLDIREAYLNRENPFSPEVSSPTLHTVAATISGQAVAAPASGAAKPVKDQTPSNEQPVEEKQPEAESEEESSEMQEETIPAEEYQPVTKQEPVAATVEESANEEVNAAMWSEDKRAEVAPVEQLIVKKAIRINNGKMDLETIAGLTRWVNHSVLQFGREQTETVLDFAELAGHLPADVKNTLVKYTTRVMVNGNGNGSGNTNGYGHHRGIVDGEGNGVGSANGNGHGHVIKTSEIISSLLEFEGLLGMDNKSEELTLLSMICQEVDR